MDTIAQTAAYVQAELNGDPAHDWWHIYRVWQTAVYLARHEAADLTIVQLAALLHDLGDWKFHDGDETAGPRLARAWLEPLAVPSAQIDHICQVIAEVSFKGAGVDTPTTTIEAAVVQDADRLDAIGAIGIARAFAYGGAHGRGLYHPDQSPELHPSFAAYQASHGHTINHFYEKLLLLQDRMQTETGRQLAAERHQFMEQFLTQFFKEWNHE